jgi:hypothetical protein
MGDFSTLCLVGSAPAQKRSSNPRRYLVVGLDEEEQLVPANPALLPPRVKEGAPSSG